MPRKAIAKIDESTGYVRVLTRIPPVLWSIAEKVGVELNLSHEQALDVVLAQIAAQLETDPEALGPFIAQVWTRLLATDKAPLSGLPPIEFDRLHTSTKTKSGFIGVYMNGQGFRAMARKSKDDPRLISVGTFPTAERAAWARYLHYKKGGMPYGVLEDLLEKWRGKFPQMVDWTDEQVLAEINETRRAAGQEELDIANPVVNETRGVVKAIGFEDGEDPGESIDS